MPDGAGPSIVPAKAGPDHPEQTQLRGWRRLLPGFRAAKDMTPSDPTENATEAPDTTQAEREMMERIVAFKKKRVDDVAIPRADIVGVEVETEISDLLKAFSEANHSRLPVYRGDLDDPLGIVHIKDVVGILSDEKNGTDTLHNGDATGEAPVLSSLLRKILYVPPSMPVTELLLRMQASRIHMALVIDEFGGTDGLVTIEDLVEQIVGDIRDEHDDGEEFTAHKIAEDRWEVDARMPLDELSDQLALSFEMPEHDADTLGGLAFSLAGRVPLRGEVISLPNGIELEIVQADPRRIQRVRLRQKPLPKPEDEAATDTSATEK